MSLANTQSFSKPYAIILCLFLPMLMMVGQTLSVWALSLASGLPMAQAIENGTIIGLSVITTAIFLILPIYAIVQHKTGRVWEFLGFKMPIWRYFWRSLGYLGAFLIISECLFFITDSDPTDFMDDLMPDAGKTFMVVATVIAAPIYEEIVFRGAMFEIIKNAWRQNRHAAIIASLVSSGFFALAHLQYEFYEMAFVFVLGLIFCHAKIHSRSLFAPMLLHFINNSLAMLFYLYQ